MGLQFDGLGGRRHVNAGSAKDGVVGDGGEAQRQRLEDARLAEALAAMAARLQPGESAAQARRQTAGQPVSTGPPAGAEDLQALGLTPREGVTLMLATSISAVKKHLGRIGEKRVIENRTAAVSCRCCDRMGVEADSRIERPFYFTLKEPPWARTTKSAATLP